MEPSNTQKETSPLAHSVRNSLPHKSHRFCSPMRKRWSHQLKSRNGIPIYGAKPIYAPENLDSFASLTLYARCARYPNSLPA